MNPRWFLPLALALCAASVPAHADLNIFATVPEWGALATDLPVNTQFLCPQVWRNNGSTALAVGVDIVHVYVETDV